MPTPSTHVVGFDDAPFSPNQRRKILLVGAVFCGNRLEGVLSGRIRRDGVDSTRVLIRLLEGSRFFRHLQAVLLQGVTVGGFNVIDLPRLQRELQRPVIAVSRKEPDRTAIREALLNKVPGGPRKWRLIEQLPPMQPAAGVYLQALGIEFAKARDLVARFAVHGNIPEPLRTAHLIAAGISRGESRHRV